MTAFLSAGMIILSVVISLIPYSRKLLDLPPPHGVSPLGTMALMFFTLIHGQARLGNRRLGVLIAGTVLVTFGVEAFSVATGLVGEYEYQDALGPKVLGVPLLIPGAWLMVLYPALLTVETILGAPPVRRVRDQHGLGLALVWCACVSLIVAFAMTGWDIGVETIITATGEYTWKVPGGYFGVPIPNFVGWVFTSAAAAFTFLAWELTAPPRQPSDRRAPEWQPIAAYFGVFVVTFFGNLAHAKGAGAMVTVFVMTPFFLIATVVLIKPRVAA